MIDDAALDSPRLASLMHRRSVLKGGIGLMAARFMGPGTAPAAGHGSSLGFAAIGGSTEDAVRVPPGYGARVLARWGDPVGDPEGHPGFRPDASNTAAEPALQFGMHHDGMAFFPLPAGSESSHRSGGTSGPSGTTRCWTSCPRKVSCAGSSPAPSARRSRASP
jgi:secreted PhoX family phosphatase